jgi:hypothetical protein
MILILALQAIFMAVILLRFVHPGAVYWLRDLVVAGMVNRAMLAAHEAGPDTRSQEFAAMLELTLRYQVTGSDPNSMMVRCLRIRELFGMLSRRDGDRGLSQRPGDLAAAIMELADMIHSLGARIPRGLDLATPVVGAEQVLGHIIKEGLGDPDDRASHIETWLAANALSIEQIGELLIAVVYALASRQDLVRRRRAP